MIASLTRKSSSIFLSTVLVVGMIAVSSPSFIIGSHAQQEYGMYNYKDPKVVVEKLRCHNDNYNIDVTNSELANELQTLLKQAQSGDNTERYVIDDNIILICSNVNNDLKFPVAEEQQPVSNLQAPTSENQINLQAPSKEQKLITCDDCLEKLSSNLQGHLITSIANSQNPIITIGDVTFDFTDITETSTIADLCFIIDAAVKANGPISITDVISTFNDLLPGLDVEGQGQVADVIICLLQAGLVELDAEINMS